MPSKPAEASPYARHIPALDGVRGLAIVGVVASHVFPSNTSSSLPMRVVQQSFTFGATGVDLFFVLSGFLITGILYETLDDSSFFRKFYARRTLRIFPLYYGVLLALLVLTPWLGIVWGREWLSLALYLQNTGWLAVPITSFDTPVHIDHFWSLAVEEQFYLVWPLLVYLLRRRTAILWACAGFALLGTLLRVYFFTARYPYHFIQINTLCRADALLTGAALSLLLRTPTRAVHDRLLAAAPALFAAGAASVALLSWASPPLESDYSTGAAILFTLRYTALALAAAGLILWCLRPGLVQRLFENKTLRTLGKYSYGIYVLHLIVFSLLRYPVSNALFRVVASKTFSVPATGVLLSVLSVGLAWVSYHAYEKQFLRLKRFFSY